jgi:hypothetical protein
LLPCERVCDHAIPSRPSKKLSITGSYPRFLRAHPVNREYCRRGSKVPITLGMTQASLEATVSKKALKSLLGGNRPLDAWERNRSLNDAIDEAYDLIDISNREARFALILMGSLNAFLVLLATQSDLLARLDPQQRTYLAGLAAVYAIVAVYFVLEAIEALKPGRFRPDLGAWPPSSPDYPKGVRYFEDVVQRDAYSHWHAWQEVRVDQLNAELAVQLHSLSIKNQVKRASLRRLYAGLRVMALLVTALICLFVYGAWN